MPTVARLATVLGAIRIRFQRGIGIAIEATGIPAVAIPLGGIVWLATSVWPCS